MSITDDELRIWGDIWTNPDVRRVLDEVIHLRREGEALTAQRDELAALVARIAAPATQYNARVYRLTDDFEALRPYLSDEDVRRAEERPSESDARVAAQRDAAQDYAEQSDAVRHAAIRRHCDAMTVIDRVRELADSWRSGGEVSEWNPLAELDAALAGASPVAADPPTEPRHDARDPFCNKWDGIEWATDRRCELCRPARSLHREG